MAEFPLDILCAVYQAPGHEISSLHLDPEHRDIVEALLINVYTLPDALFCDWFNLQLDERGVLCVTFFVDRPEKAELRDCIGSETIDVELTGHDILFLATDQT